MTLFQSNSSRPVLVNDSDRGAPKKLTGTPGGPRLNQSVDLKGTSMNIQRTTIPVAASEICASAGQDISERHAIGPAAQIPPTKVLVIDEERMAAEEMVATLIDAGFQCEIAGRSNNHDCSGHFQYAGPGQPGYHSHTSR